MCSKIILSLEGNNEVAISALTASHGVTEVAIAATDIVMDIVILCLPLPMITGLQMDRKRKLIILGIFWLGTL